MCSLSATAAPEESPHVMLRDRLLSLSDDRCLTDILQVVGEQVFHSTAPTFWRRTYGRLHPGKEPYATLVFESKRPSQLLCRIDLFSDGAAAANEASARRETWLQLLAANSDQSISPPLNACQPHESLGWILAATFPCDGALPTLPSVMAINPTPHVVRYRPDRRCTVRQTGESGTLFGKVFTHVEEGYQQHLDAIRLHDAATRGELAFAVAPPHHWDDQRLCLWHDALPGEPLDHDDFAVDGDRLARRLGEALASLANSTLKPPKVFGPVEQWQRTVRTADDLARRVPALRQDLDDFLFDLKQLHLAFQARPLRPIHGSPHAKQWLDQGERLGLVDFEKLCLGDPELDLGTFLAELDFEDPREINIPLVATAFIQGFEAHAGKVDHCRLTAYRAHKQLVKALKSAQSLRIDGDHRARRHLQRAINGLRRNVES